MIVKVTTVGTLSRSLPTGKEMIEGEILNYENNTKLFKLRKIDFTISSLTRGKPQGYDYVP